MNQKFWWDLLSEDEKKPLDCDVFGFWGEKDDRVKVEEMQAWKKLTTKKFELHAYEGNHFFIHDDQNNAEFLEEVGALLREYYH